MLAIVSPLRTMKKIIPIEAKTFDIKEDWVGREKFIWVIERGVGFQSRVQIRA